MTFEELLARIDPALLQTDTQVAVTALNEAGESSRPKPVRFYGDMGSCAGP